MYQETSNELDKMISSEDNLPLADAMLILFCPIIFDPANENFIYEMSQILV